MFDKEAIETLQKHQAIHEVKHAVLDALKVEGVVLLPEEFKTHDLEQFMPVRRRMRGTMTTNVIADFATYVGNHHDKTTVFVNQDNMAATAVLDHGTKATPLHCEHRAVVSLKKTAAYEALLSIVGRSQSQTLVAEFLEDWIEHVSCFKDGERVTPARAIAAIRKLTIESARKVESSEQSLSASKSAFESVQATSSEPLPTHIYFECQPYNDLDKRLFVLRFGALTGGEKPSIALRIAMQEKHYEEMAVEFATLVRQALADKAQIDATSVVIGTFAK